MYGGERGYEDVLRLYNNNDNDTNSTESACSHEDRLIALRALARTPLPHLIQRTLVPTPISQLSSLSIVCQPPSHSSPLHLLLLLLLLKGMLFTSVRAGDVGQVLKSTCDHGPLGLQLTWQFIKDNWPAFLQRYRVCQSISY